MIQLIEGREISLGTRQYASQSILLALFMVHRLAKYELANQKGLQHFSGYPAIFAGGWGGVGERRGEEESVDDCINDILTYL